MSPLLRAELFWIRDDGSVTSSANTGLAHLEVLQGKDRPSVMRIAVKWPGHGRGEEGGGRAGGGGVCVARLPKEKLNCQ